MIKLCETPVNQTKLSFLMIDHDVMRFHVTVHDSLRMAIIQCLESVLPNRDTKKVSKTCGGKQEMRDWGKYLEEFEDVVSIVVVGEFGI
jgi:hypothetical protein